MCADLSLHPWRNESRSRCGRVLIAPLCSGTVASALALGAPEQGSLYSAWILFSLQPAAALLGFLIQRLWLPPLLKACASFAQRTIWIHSTLNNCAGQSPVWRRTVRKWVDLRVLTAVWSILSKLVHLENAAYGRQGSRSGYKSHTSIFPLSQSISHSDHEYALFLAFSLGSRRSNWTCYISMGNLTFLKPGMQLIFSLGKRRISKKCIVFRWEPGESVRLKTWAWFEFCTRRWTWQKVL